MKDANILKIGTLNLIVKGKISDSYDTMYKKAVELAKLDYRNEHIPKLINNPKLIWKKQDYLQRRTKYHLSNMYELIKIKIKSMK
jgi:hypothetical protein